MLTLKISQRNQIEKAEFTRCGYFMIKWDNKTKYLGCNVQQVILEIIAPLEKSPSFGAKSRHQAII